MDKNTQNKNWKNIDINFTKELQKEWEDRGFSYEECKEWIDIGLIPQDFDYVKWLRDAKKVDVKWVLNHGNSEKLRKEYKDYSISRWHGKGFTDEEVSAWRNVGLGLQDGGYAVWMRNILKIAPKEYTEYLGESNDDSLLREQHQKFLEERSLQKKEIESSRNWEDIHPDFTPELQKVWEQQGFNYEEAEKWINIVGLRLTEVEFARWLKDGNQIDLEWILNYKESGGNIEDIREGYRKHSKNEHYTEKINESSRFLPISAQEWLDKNYLKEDRKKITRLDISPHTLREEGLLSKNEYLKGSLKLQDFVNLEEFASINNEITNLDLSKNNELTSVVCFLNRINNADFLEQLPCPEKLTFLDLSSNNIIRSDLKIFSRFINLRNLYIGMTKFDWLCKTDLEEKLIKKGFYNRFYGSLEPLKNLNKLDVLNISDTDVDSGLEHLPESLRSVTCGSYRKNAGVLKIIEILKPYTLEEGSPYYDIKKWRENNRNLGKKIRQPNSQSVEKGNDPELMELLIKKEVEGEVEKISFFDTWFNENCAIVINKEKSLLKQITHNLWIVTHEPAFGKVEARINCLKVVKEITPIKANWERIIKVFKESLNSDHPAAQLYNNDYSRKLPSLKQNYENIIKRKVKLSLQTNPDDYLKPYDIVKRKIDSAGISHHYAIYLGDNQVVHISGQKEIIGEAGSLYARKDSWEKFLKNENEIEIHHPFIPFKKSELISKHIEIAINAKYGQNEYHLLKKNCEHFASLCVYGSDVSKQSKVISEVTKNSEYLLKAIEKSNEFFEILKNRRDKVSAQGWLDENYTTEQRAKMKELDISSRSLIGSLKLEGFTSLKDLNCSDNKLTSLILGDCKELTKLICHNNQLTNLVIELEQLSHPEKLTELSIHSNNIPKQDLAFLKPFVGMEELYLGKHNNGEQEFFYGTLEPLKSMTKLKYLDISFTEVDSGLEYLPESLSETNKFHCDYDLGNTKTKVVKVYEQLEPYSFLLYTWKKDNPKLVRKVRKTDKTDKTSIKTILLIGSTGSGKSALANVITGTDRFKEGEYGVSETRDLQVEKVDIDGISYRVIDTVGLGDTKLSEEEVLSKLNKLSDYIEEGLSQVFFLVEGKFTKDKVKTYKLLKKIIFDNKTDKYTTILRTKFSGFRKPEKCAEDKKKMSVESKEIEEIIKNCNGIVHVNNLNEDDDPELKARAECRKILIDYLKNNCQEVYKLEQEIEEKIQIPPK